MSSVTYLGISLIDHEADLLADPDEAAVLLSKALVMQLYHSTGIEAVALIDKIHSSPCDGERGLVVFTTPYAILNVCEGSPRSN